MNYRHAFHAGNHADVLKHLVLSRLLALLAKKDAPYAYLDSHAGIGLYDLRGDQATRTGEWLEGIQRVWQADDVPALFDDYLGVIRALNPDGQLRYYPGSPEVARELSREQDRLQLNEKHPEDGQLLKANMKYDRRVAVHLGEGWHVPRALLPTAQKRAVLLIDPPFEQADELQRCAQAMKESIARMRQAVVAIWYPIKDQRQLKRFYQDLQGTGAPKLLRVELLVHAADNADVGLNGSGLAIANPPWGLEDELRSVLPWLGQNLGQTQGGWKLDWLIEEQPAG
ncbi:MAG TPA: 23S rRNA (adenine(2030)-N(6))-methyltransferase RlmJ [Pseudomonas sp.]|uniref:23S rRNA (adenine(2030)-N(6))-methyltransferase RlmJ n=1 Tax=Pseudomonas sp. TaxID=306 RepID=UPI002C2E2190|nr:23S rRNA (adenine(2030)-N(6))-methyltransferase RlmJ [Pseudomonas sp.]HRL91974.1 23S rRNA (adenine(2030)-N(6))-methyltransferase RlmJ [Pseudomonas sp.]